MSPKPLRGTRFFLLITALLLAAPVQVRADEVQLKPDHPERYTVVKGDTLWDVSTRFLKSPGHWPKIWKINDQIKNPHLIYPGDVVVLRMVDGKPVLTVERKDKASGLPSLPEAAKAPDAPVGERRVDDRTVKLSPQARSEPLEAAIPTIPPNAIVPFLTRPLAVEENELEQAGYITTGLDDRIALGDSSQFYARGLQDDAAEYYQIFRPGKLVVTAVKQEIIPTDRLLTAPKKASLPYYYPHAPKTQVQGRIVSALNAVAEIGPQTGVGISLGAREGIEEGNVLRIMRHVGTHKDPLTRERYKLPDEESGLLLIFRTYEKMSYGLGMTAPRPVPLLDAVIPP